MTNTKKYLTDVIDIKKLKKNELNLILSGVGTGKRRFALSSEGLIKKLNEDLKMSIQPHEILCVTSRAMIVSQQDADVETIAKKKDKAIISKWYNSLFEDSYKTNNIVTMTYNAFYKLLDNEMLIKDNTRLVETIKVIIFDEIHAIVKDETFIKEMGRVKEFIINRLNMPNSEMYLIGMTATDKLLRQGLNIKINYMLEEPLHNYLVDNIYVCNPLDVAVILKDLKGKSLVLIDNPKMAYELQERIGKEAQIIVAKSNKACTAEMNSLREYIIQEQALPETCEALITTSCMREGINISAEKTKISNIVCYDVSSTTVQQFVGRYRGNLSNLVLVNSAVNVQNQVVTEQREYENFKLLFEGDKTYLQEIKGILRHGEKSNVIVWDGYKQKIRFLREYIDAEWLNKVIAAKE